MIDRPGLYMSSAVYHGISTVAISRLNIWHLCLEHTSESARTSYWGETTLYISLTGSWDSSVKGNVFSCCFQIALTCQMIQLTIQQLLEQRRGKCPRFADDTCASALDKALTLSPWSEHDILYTCRQRLQPFFFKKKIKSLCSLRYKNLTSVLDSPIIICFNIF